MKKLIAWKLIRRKEDKSKETYDNGNMIKRIYYLDQIGQHNFAPEQIEEFFSLLHSLKTPFNICKLVNVFKENEKKLVVHEKRYPCNGLIAKVALSKPEWAEYVSRLLENNYIGEFDNDFYQCKQNLFKAKILELGTDIHDAFINVLLSSFLGSYTSIASAFAFLHSLSLDKFKKFKFYETMNPSRIIQNYIKYTNEVVKIEKNLILRKYFEKFADDLPFILKVLDVSQDKMKNDLPNALLYGDLNDMNYFMSNGKLTLFDWDEARIDLRIWEFTRYFIYGGHGIEITDDFINRFIQSYNEALDIIGNPAMIMGYSEKVLIKWYMLLDWAYCLCFSFSMRRWQTASVRNTMIFQDYKDILKQFLYYEIDSDNIYFTTYISNENFVILEKQGIPYDLLNVLKQAQTLFEVRVEKKMNDMHAKFRQIKKLLDPELATYEL